MHSVPLFLEHISREIIVCPGFSDNEPKPGQSVKTIELSNRYLTARFTPEIGCRLYDLTWNDDPLQQTYNIKNRNS